MEEEEKEEEKEEKEKEMWSVQCGRKDGKTLLAPRRLRQPLSPYIKPRHARCSIQSPDEPRHVEIKQEHFLLRRPRRQQHRVPKGWRGPVATRDNAGRWRRRRASPQLSQPLRPVLLRNLGFPLVDELRTATRAAKAGERALPRSLCWPPLPSARRRRPTCGTSPDERKSPLDLGRTERTRAQIREKEPS